MTDTVGIYQGKITPLAEIKVSPLSRAYTFSDSIYEVIPFYKGKDFALKNTFLDLMNVPIE